MHTTAPYTDGTIVTSTDGKARACFVYIGEGYDGDYDESDPNDAALYRLDVFVAAEYTDRVDGEPTDEPDWVYPADGSICTLVKVDTINDADWNDLLGYAANTVAQALATGSTSVKGAMDRLSYLPTKR